MTASNNGNPATPAEKAPPKWLAHHFENPRQQYESGKLGIWIFLLTEILFFSGLFCVYAVFRATNPQVFVDGHYLLDTRLGAINTVVLIFSSLTMALAVRYTQREQRAGAIVCLLLTLVCASGFLVIKGFEYHGKWQHGLVPGQQRIEYWKQHPEYSQNRLWHWMVGNAGKEGEPAAGQTDLPERKFEPDIEYIEQHVARADRTRAGDPTLADHVANVRTFVGIYFCLTGLHALHVIAGMIAIVWVLCRTVRGHFNRHYFGPVDYVGLYWHLVDLIWIYLFPLLYLIG